MVEVTAKIGDNLIFHTAYTDLNDVQQAILQAETYIRRELMNANDVLGKENEINLRAVFSVEKQIKQQEIAVKLYSDYTYDSVNAIKFKE